MKFLSPILLLAVTLPLSVAKAGETQTMRAECYERAVLLDSLAVDLGERLAQTRRVGASGLLEAFKSPTDGTWTIVYSNDERISCVLAAGNGLETDEEPSGPVLGAREFAI